MSDLYTVVDEGPDEYPRTQVITFFTDVEEARDLATHPDRVAPGTVYQLVEPGTPPPHLDYLPMSPQLARLESARIAAGLHAEIGIDEGEHVVRTAAEVAAFVIDGTVPEEDEEDKPAPRIVVRGDGERSEVLIDGEVVASISFAEAGHEGMRAVEQAAMRVAAALGVDVFDGQGAKW